MDTKRTIGTDFLYVFAPMTEWFTTSSIMPEVTLFHTKILDFKVSKLACRFGLTHWTWKKFSQKNYINWNMTGRSRKKLHQLEYDGALEETLQEISRTICMEVK